MTTTKTIKVEEETIEQKISRLKEEQKGQMAELLAQKLELDAKVKELKDQEKVAKAEQKAETAKLRTEKLQELLLNGSVEIKENKSQKIRSLILDGKSKADIVILTGYSNKFCLDTIWRIEKELGLR